MKTFNLNKELAKQSLKILSKVLYYVGLIYLAINYVLFVKDFEPEVLMLYIVIPAIILLAVGYYKLIGLRIKIVKNELIIKIYDSQIEQIKSEMGLRKTQIFILEQLEKKEK